MTERELFAEQWRAVAAALGAQIAAPYELTLSDGTHWTFAVLLRLFGGDHGMLVDVATTRCWEFEVPARAGAGVQESHSCGEHLALGRSR